MKRTFAGSGSTNRRRVALGSGAVLLGLVLPLLAGCPKPQTEPSPDASATPVALTQDETKDPILPKDPVATPSAPSDSKMIAIYHVVPGSGDKRSSLKKEMVPVRDGENPAVTALNETAAQKDSPLPKGTQAQSVEVAEGVATVNFNKAFGDNFTGAEGGDDREALIFNAVTASLGQFEGVKQVQILVDGKKVSLGGTQDTTEPIPVPDTTGTKVSLRP